MDNEAVLRQFEEIEKRVEKMIDLCNFLKSANLELQQKNEALEEEIQARIEAERAFVEERGLIRSRIDGLLNRLEDLSEAVPEAGER